MKRKYQFIRILSFSVAILFAFTNFSYASSKAGIKKDETVFVTLKTNGMPKEKIVSDWLHADRSVKCIKDKSTLKNLTNIKGNEIPSINNDKVLWNTSSRDIFYQGTIEKNLPIDVNLKYFLNDKLVNPKDIAGKSGKIKIQVELKNKDKHIVKINGKSRTLYTPFTALGIINLPIDNFYNVKVNSGEILSDGTNQIVSFISLPGLKESLNIKDDLIDLPDTIEVTATTRAFKLGSIIITGTPEIPDSKALKKDKKISDVIDGFKKIKDASKKLCEGSAKLASGNKTLAVSFSTFSKGINKAKNGVKQLKDGSEQLKSGLATANNGVKTLDNGIGLLSSNAKKLGDGAVKIGDGASAFADNASKLCDGFEKTSDAIKQASEKTNDLKKGADSLVKSTEQIKQAQSQVISGIDKSLSAIKQLKEGKQKELKVVDMLISGVDSVIKIPDMLSQVPGFKDIGDKLAGYLGQQKNALTQLKGSGDKYVDALSQLEDGVSGIKTASEKLYGGMGQVQDGQMKLSEGAGKIAEGGAALKPVVEQLTAGTGALKLGALQISVGAKQLNDGGKQFKDGADKLSDGSKKISGGLDKLYNGSSALNSNLSNLYSGMCTLSDATNKLINGSNKLASGSSVLTQNLNKFNNEGIGKIDSEIKDKIGSMDDIIPVKNKLIALSDSYNTFSGIDKDMNGSVKFILRTDEIKIPEVKVVSHEKKNNKKEGFFNWLFSLF